jgi:hypothetical protein
MLDGEAYLLLLTRLLIILLFATLVWLPLIQLVFCDEEASSLVDVVVCCNFQFLVKLICKVASVLRVILFWLLVEDRWVVFYCERLA